MEHIKCPGSELKLVVAIRKWKTKHLLFYVAFILKSDILNTKNLTCKQEEHGFHSKKYWHLRKWKMSFLPGYSGFNLNRNWHLSKVKINSTKSRSMGKVVFTQVKINYLKKMRFTDKTTYAQMMVLTRSKMASVLGRSTFLLQKSSILKNSDSLRNWVPL